MRKLIILFTLILTGCAGQHLGDPDTVSYNIFEHHWNGYKNPKITIIDNANPDYFANESARLAMKNGEYFILCKSICSKKEIEHEESHALAHFNGYEDETHRN